MVTSKGSVLIEMDSKAAPETVANFLGYVKKGFYNNTIFHRVIKGFMIQGGGLSPDMVKKETDKPIANEADIKCLSNVAGTIAMARTSDPHSATSQFFINANDNLFLVHFGTPANSDIVTPERHSASEDPRQQSPANCFHVVLVAIQVTYKDLLLVPYPDYEYHKEHGNHQ